MSGNVLQLVQPPPEYGDGDGDEPTQYYCEDCDGDIFKAWAPNLLECSNCGATYETGIPD